MSNGDEASSLEEASWLEFGPEQQQLTRHMLPSEAQARHLEQPVHFCCFCNQWYSYHLKVD